jgi:hypothetical protein
MPLNEYLTPFLQILVAHERHLPNDDDPVPFDALSLLKIPSQSKPGLDGGVETYHKVPSDTAGAKGSTTVL